MSLTDGQQLGDVYWSLYSHSTFSHSIIFLFLYSNTLFLVSPTFYCTGENHWSPCDWPQCRGDDSGLRCCHPHASYKGWFWCHHWDSSDCIWELHHTGQDQELWGRPPELGLLRLSTHWLTTPPRHTQHPTTTVHCSTWTDWTVDFTRSPTTEMGTAK